VFSILLLLASLLRCVENKKGKEKFATGPKNGANEGHNTSYDKLKAE
jgi:hypothetical protein